MSGGSVCVYNYIFEFKIELSSDIKFMLVDNVDKKEQIFNLDFQLVFLYFFEMLFV